MKKLTLFLLTILISCSAWGVNITGGTKLYLKPNSNWTQSNAWFAAYFCNGSSGIYWVKMTDNDADGFYEATVPSGQSHKNVLFLRMDPSNKNTNGNSWPNPWNQTNDLTWDGTKDTYTIANGAWSNGSGTWSKMPEMYFANTGGWEIGELKFMMGHNSYSRGKKMTIISNTGLYHVDHSLWSDYTQWAVFNTDANSIWGGESNNIEHRNDYTKNEEYTTTGNKNLKTYSLLNVDGTVTELTSYTSLNHDQTIKVTTNNSASTTGGSITASSHKLTAVSTASASSGSTSGATTTLSAAYTATVTLEATAKTGYKFVGWYEGSTEKSTNTTYTYTAENKEKTITAKFKIKKYTITANVNEREAGIVEGGGTYDYGATPTLTAKANSGYEFVEWQQNGTRVSTANPYTTPKVTSEATYTAIFKYKDVTFTDPSTLEFATYGQLTYQLSMPSDKWYWISLPFKVDIDEITTSTGNGAKDLVITYYDAKERATTGKGGWKNATEQGLTTLTANQGYVIGPKTTKENEGDKFPGMTVTFPSASPTNTVASSANLATTEATGENEKDNNWHIIGTGLYHQTSTLDGVNYIAVPDNAGDYTYYYVNAPATDIFDTEFTNYTFNPFEAFFVQHGGEYSATATDAQSAALAPVARAKAQQQEQIYLINMNEAHTVVILNAEGSEGYTAGEDFLEMNASNHSDLIYSFDGSDALAFNHRAPEAQSINLGGYVATAGEQTISLKGYNANVESVTLVDNVTGETADLLAGDYTFNAEVGSLDGRFTVVFGAPKAGDTTVDCYNSTANQLIAYGSANACTVSGLTTGEAIAIYNTMGQLVFCTIAESETLTLPSLTTGNYLILHNGTTNKVLLK